MDDAEHRIATPRGLDFEPLGPPEISLGEGSFRSASRAVHARGIERREAENAVCGMVDFPGKIGLEPNIINIIGRWGEP